MAATELNAFHLLSLPFFPTLPRFFFSIVCSITVVPILRPPHIALSLPTHPHLPH